jgi:PBSX family phage terminase large subunit
VLFDEVALMPRSFVEQALARCSVEGSKFWFNCNPQSPYHWFYTGWISAPERKNAFYLHFTMEDNPSLSPAMLERYRKLHTGLFYRRYVKGEWVAAEGLVYPMFSHEHNIVGHVPAGITRYLVSCDYGTVNPASFGLWGETGGVWTRIREFYHDSRTAGFQKTDAEYADDLERLIGGLAVEAVIVDPSASSFMECIRRRGKYHVAPAKNHVADGVRLVGGMLKLRTLRFHRDCRDCIREVACYQWDSGAHGDVPRKENDHAMDDVRYLAAYVNAHTTAGFYAAAVER